MRNRMRTLVEDMQVNAVIQEGFVLGEGWCIFGAIVQATRAWTHAGCFEQRHLEARHVRV